MKRICAKILAWGRGGGLFKLLGMRGLAWLVGSGLAWLVGSGLVWLEPNGPGPNGPGARAGPLGPMGPGPGPLGTWTHMGPSAWAHVGPYGPIWAHLV